MGNNIEDAMYERMGRELQARHEFEKLPKEEQDQILKAREAKRIKDGWAAARRSDWRRWRGR